MLHSILTPAHGDMKPQLQESCPANPLEKEHIQVQQDYKALKSLPLNIYPVPLGYLLVCCYEEAKL